MTRSIEVVGYQYDRHGDATVLEQRTRVLSAPGPNEVTVEIVCAGVNHMDALIRRGVEQAWADDPWPRSSGSDFAGIVVACGPGVTALHRGSEVIGHVRSGAHATHVNVSVASLVVKPRNLSWELAGGMFLAGGTALTTLDELRIGHDDTIVISAAAGGVGSIEAQLAKHWGARVIGTCGDRNFDYLRQLGIIPVKYGDGIADRIRHVAHGPVTAFIDNFGKDGEGLAVELGVPDGRYRSSADRRDVEVALLREDPDSVRSGTTQLQRLAHLAQLGAFRLLVSGLYPLADIVEAFEDLDRLHARGKIVLATHPVAAYRTLRARDVHEALP
ncbi:NADP-dependent oxidoreductase [Microbacterium sulfonylureivorans]|uniref:NADP-dependent oxidoreductase n=1 Tax=Microbacterium sulfonylureivorans TaxID=2486854 RepID=UPI001F0BBA36|nr:NADP-dependent oxidoreductase [Microbacterium sulfonylureivorans]